MQPKEEVNAKKETYGEAEAFGLLEGINDLYVAKGKKIVRINLKKEEPSKADLKKLILGPTGNLRAPTLRKGKTLMVGFHEETYEKLFG